MCLFIYVLDIYLKRKKSYIGDKKRSVIKITHFTVLVRDYLEITKEKKCI